MNWDFISFGTVVVAGVLGCWRLAESHKGKRCLQKRVAELEQKAAALEAENLELKAQLARLRGDASGGLRFSV